MLKSIFLKIFSMSITASIVILRVLGLRYLFRKQPKIYSYVLWSLVLFRLLCPYSISMETSLFNIVPASYSSDGQIQYVIISDAVKDNAAAGNNITHSIENNEFIQENNTATIIENTENNINEYKDGQVSPSVSETKQQIDYISVISCIWLTGILFLLCRNLVSMHQLKTILADSKMFYGNVRLCKNISTAFITGIFKPVIYLPYDLNEDEINHVIIHEETHISRGDYIFKLIGFVALCLHWFNPMVWLAFRLAEKDMEMSCDEAVIRKLGKNSRRNYSQTLLSISAPYQNNHLHLAFGEGDTKNRILNILNYKQPAFKYAVGICIVIVVSAAMLIFNPGGIKVSEIINSDIEQNYDVVMTYNGDYMYVPAVVMPDLLDDIEIAPAENAEIKTENSTTAFILYSEDNKIYINFNEDFSQVWILEENSENNGAVYDVKNIQRVSSFFVANLEHYSDATEGKQLIFPALSGISSSQSYLVDIELPQGWFISSKSYDNRSVNAHIDSNYSRVDIINDAKETVGSITFGEYNLEDVTPEDIYKDISNRSGYGFFDEDDKISDHIYSDDIHTIYHSMSDKDEMAEFFYPLILSCYEKEKVYTAVTFFPDRINDILIDKIATSINISPVEDVTQRPVNSLGVFWIKEGDDESYIADYAVATHLRKNLNLDNYTVEEIKVTSPLYSSIPEFNYPDDIFTGYMYVIQAKYLLYNTSFTSLIYIKQTSETVFEIIGSVEDSMIIGPESINTTYAQTQRRIVRIAPSVKVEKDMTMTLGTHKIISEGVYGLAVEEAVVTYHNGVVVSEDVVETNVLYESQPQISATGVLWNGVPIQGGTGQLIWPVYGGRVSRGFTGQYPYNHNGIDIAAPTGTHIFAAADGVVTKALYADVGYGIYCEIDHGDFQTLYGQCSELDIAVGQKVAQGQLIGAVGSTGNSTGPHLHFEVKQGSERLDPYNYF